jgi:hypothetical protein
MVENVAHTVWYAQTHPITLKELVETGFAHACKIKFGTMRKAVSAAGTNILKRVLIKRPAI